jgi:hypothetical protein
MVKAIMNKLIKFDGLDKARGIVINAMSAVSDSFGILDYIYYAICPKSDPFKKLRRIDLYLRMQTQVLLDNWKTLE